MKRPEGANPFFIILAAVAILAVVSLLPLSHMTGGRIKNFNLLADIMPLRGDIPEAISPGTPSEGVDPELLILEAADSAAEATAPDTTAKAGASEIPERIISSDSLPPVRPSRIGDTVAIEDYSPSGNGMKALRDALRAGQTARIAFVGDSYIEGDIICQDFRSLMQERYGGGGVGYVNLYSEFPGFRRSVRQSGGGWKEMQPKKGAKTEYLGLPEDYFTPDGKAKSSYKGVKKLPGAQSWSRSSLLFVAPAGGEIKTHIDSDTTDWQTHVLAPSPDVQCLLVSGETSEFKLETATKGLIALGVWLDSPSGISVDCISSRGHSGLTLTKISSGLCRQESAFVDYQLIILEFGINAMSSDQTDYHVYSRGMAKVIAHIRECYPGADILIMGIGDRGEKKGGEVHSISTAEAMTRAQRTTARETGCMFWDTREAMGGRDAIVAYASEGLANKDYVHLTHKGGRLLAEELFKAFTKVIDQ